jgi:hypothetical protein
MGINSQLEVGWYVLGPILAVRGCSILAKVNHYTNT